jgi:hypothetical protein
MAGLKRLRFLDDGKSVFRALDVECSGYISKREFQVLNKFHPHATPESEVPVKRSFKVDPQSLSAKRASKAAGHPAVQSQLNFRSSSTPSLAASERPDNLSKPTSRVGVPRPGESNLQPAHLQQQLADCVSGSGYPYKGHSRMLGKNVPELSAIAERPSAQKLKQERHMPEQVQDSGAASLVASLADCSRYPYRGRLNDAACKKIVGPTTPSFGATMASGAKQQGSVPCDAATDSESRASEIPLVCEDELLDVEAGEISSSESDSLSPRSLTPRSLTPRDLTEIAASYEPAAISLKSRPVASLVSTESSGSGCSTPRSLDTGSTPSMPSRQEGPRSSSASSASGAAWAPRPYVAPGKVDEVSLEVDADLQAEVRQLLLQYQLDHKSARPEVGLLQTRKPKEACGPELSSMSAWVHPDMAQQA